MNYWKKLQARQDANESLLCVGLDPVVERLPEGLNKLPGDIFAFTSAIIDATKDLVCAYKPNIAFYEAEGLEGLKALKQTIEYIPDDIPVILDCKRGDIGHSSAAYARGMFEFFEADAITVAPYLGYDSISPFAEYTDRGIYILALTSNQGVLDFQYQEIKNEGKQLYEIVSTKVEEWNKKFANFALVTGATHPDELKRVRAKAPSLPFLIPGIGAQGGELQKTLEHANTAAGIPPVIVVARSVIYASAGKDFAEMAREAAKGYRDTINQYR